MSIAAPSGIQVLGAVDDAAAAILSPDALAFLGELHRRFEATRRSLLTQRRRRQLELDAGARPYPRVETAELRAQDWSVAPAPPALRKRWVEITGPTDRKLLINALNSGATGFMADFEDSNTPTWANMIGGQANLREAVRGTLEHHEPDGRGYRLDDTVATLLVRPRGWHLVERHLTVDGDAIAGALFDFGLHLFHNAQALLDAGLGPYFYLPKLERHEEARLWNDVFCAAQDALGIPRGTIKATALIETVPAAFEMDELLWELREHSAGLNAGRWDYIFSMIKTLRADPDVVLPDRGAITMTVPFMRAYTELLVATCHRRGAHAMGGMAAFIPSRRDAEVNRAALAQVEADKRREVDGGFDGTWVAHPDLVPVAMNVFAAALGEQPNQLAREHAAVAIEASRLLDVGSTPGQVTEAGLRGNVSVAIQYLASWLRGNGAVGVNNLMEDVATAEISRAQVWQWVQHGAAIDGRPLDAARVRATSDEELGQIRAGVGDDAFAAGRYEDARRLFERIALADELVPFLTLPGYELLA